MVNNKRNRTNEAIAEPMDVDRSNENLNISDDEEGGTRIGDIYIPPPIKPYCSNESVGPRLVIHKILNFNFKSYAGEVLLGPFCYRFQTIIGPNGSGKSNVIDSMLFVFGYRANKIRCKKLSVLLHNSSEHPDTNSCKVAVYFKQIVDKDFETFEEVPNSEFFISRTAFKDNSSFYTINDKKVQFKEVSKLLKEHNVDLDHNRFLILQGEVESIAMMKSKGQSENECGLLEYLEDIVGTTRYKEPLVKINNRVDAYTEERTDKHNRCKMAEREMNDLKEPMENAVEFLKLENELARKKNLHIQKYISDQMINLKKFEDEREKGAADLNEHDEKFKKIADERCEKQSLIKEEIAKCDHLTQAKVDCEKRSEEAKSKYDEIQSLMMTTNKRRKAAMSSAKIEQKLLEELKLVPEKNAKEMVETKQQIEKITKQKTECEDKLQENLLTLQNETQPLIDQKDKLQTESVSLQKNVDDAMGELNIVEAELKIVKHNEISEERKYLSLKDSFDDSKKTLEEKSKRLTELKTSVPQIEQRIVESQRNLEANKKEEYDLSVKLSSQRADMEEKMSAMKMSRSNNKVLDALMKEKVQGNIPGILGRLGDLGGIDSKYDTAISTCCGLLDYIVVDTVNTAAECIEHLKRVNAGRASFIALEKVSYLANQAAKRLQTPENVHRIYDLIRVEDERVMPAFYFALRDTLVANDLDQGSRIAYGQIRYRVVTLRGDLIEKAGTMSGGGRPLSGRMGQTVKTKTARNDANTSLSSVNVERIQIEIREIATRISQLQEEQGAIEREIITLKNTLKINLSEIKRLSFDVPNFAEEIQRVEERLQYQENIMKQTKSDPEKVNELQLRITEKTTVLEKSKAKAKKITDQVNGLTKQISCITDEKVKSVKQNIDTLGAKITKLTKHVSKLNVDIISSGRNIEKCEQKIINLETEIKNDEEFLKNAANERAEFDVQRKEFCEKADEIDKQINLIQSQWGDINKEIQTILNQENEGKITRLELEKTVQGIDKKISDIKDQLPHLRNKLKPLKLHEIPNEEEQEPLKIYTEEELGKCKLQDLTYRISVLEENLKDMNPNLNVIDEYFKKREVYLERVQLLADITTRRNEMRQLYDDVRKKRYTEFMQGYSIISKKLKEMYQMITQGGDAELELVDSMDPFSEGVSFGVRPPKKSWKNISNLSGGEKTLSSLALVFALHYYKPSPLYFMDEIDAALDFRNISIVANYIKERTKNAQFIIISLRTNMFELADALTGIYKVNDCTQSLTVENFVHNFVPVTNSV